MNFNGDIVMKTTQRLNRLDRIFDVFPSVQEAYDCLAGRTGTQASARSWCFISLSGRIKKVNSLVNTFTTYCLYKKLCVYLEQNV